jgi:TolA-binding protein
VHLGAANPRTLYEAGMSAFDRQEYLLARRYFAMALQRGADPSLEANYFYAVSFYRESDWKATVREFESILKNHPGSRWTAAAHWHIAKALHELADNHGARRHFQYIIDHFPNDRHLVTLSQAGLDALHVTADGMVPRLWWELKEAVFH